MKVPREIFRIVLTAMFGSRRIYSYESAQKWVIEWKFYIIVTIIDINYVQIVFFIQQIVIKCMNFVICHRVEVTHWTDPTSRTSTHFKAESSAKRHRRVNATLYNIVNCRKLEPFDLRGQLQKTYFAYRFSFNDPTTINKYWPCGCRTMNA